MRVGVIADTHLPWAHPKYLAFCLDTFDKWGVNRIHHIGDFADHHSLSRFTKDPRLPSAGGEYDATRTKAEQWREALGPRIHVSKGNHDLRLFDRAAEAGIPAQYLRSYNELWGTKGWTWHDEPVEIDGVLYEHGFGSGANVTLRRAMEYMQSLVMGHTHAHAGVYWHTCPSRRIFGLNVGFGGDCTALAFAYGKPFVRRPVLGCGVVIDGEEPHFIPMKCGPKEKYHRGKK